MKATFSIIVLIITTVNVPAQNFGWQQTEGPAGGYVRALVHDANGNLFAGTDGGLFKSTDNGDNWTLKSGDIGYSYIYSMAVSPNGTIFAGTFYNKIFRSTDEGNSWTQIGSNVYYIIDAMAVKPDGTVFAGIEESDGSSGGTVYRSTNNGDSWTEVNSGLPDAAVWQIRIDDNGSVFIAEIYGIFRSTNNGTSWTQLTNGISITVASDISINPLNNYIYASGYSSSGNAIFRSTNGGDSFTQLTFPIDIDAQTLDVSPTGHLFLGTVHYYYPSVSYGIYRSTDDGMTFTQVDSSVSVKRFAFGTSGQIFAGGNLGVHLSSDDGNSWELKVSGMNGVKVNVIASDIFSNIYAGTGNGPYRSTDFGNTWELLGSPLQLRSTAGTVTTSNGYVFIVNDNGGVFRSTDSGENWTQLSINGSLSAMFAASNDYLFFNAPYQDLFRSTDYGDTWIPQNSGLPGDIVAEDFTENSSGTIYMATEFSGIYQTANYGDSWTPFSNYTGYIDHIASNGSGDVFWSTSDSYSNDNEFYRSADNGLTYMQLTVVPGNTGVISDILISPDQNIYAAVTENNLGGVYRSTNNGDTFEQVSDGLTEKQLTSLAVDAQNHLLAGTTRGVFRSLQNVPVELNSFTVSVSGNDVFLNWTTATETNNKGFEIQKSTVRSQKSVPAKWEEIGFVNGSGTSTEPKSYSFTNNKVSTGTYSYRLKQIDFNGSFEYSSIVNIAVNIPNEFSLSQNYPNPFNPSTQISYTLPEDKFVTLKVYNALGQQVAELVNEFNKAGNHSVSFDAANLSSGIYYYRIETGSQTLVRKMLLLK